MHKISIPVVVSERFDKEKTLKELKRANADYVFLALGVLSAKKENRDKEFAPLKELIPFFKEHGFKVGVWFWTFWYKELDDCDLNTLLQANHHGELKIYDTELNNNTKICSGTICPTSEKAMEFVTDAVKCICSFSPDIILFDDDYDYTTHLNSIGCYCDNHLKLMAEKLGEPITREELRNAVTDKKPNKIREIWYSLLGETLEEFAINVRKAVDSVNPNIRFGQCSVMSMWGTDGTNPNRTARLLAGNSKPFLRLIGAPYWAPLYGWQNRLQNVIELSRMEANWITEDDFEILAEGDVYPRPRYKVPANYLECYDTALRASGELDGIHKYMIDYTSSADYETGYIDRHLKNADNYDAIERIFGDKTAVGVRVYEFMEKYPKADLKNIPDPEDYVYHFFFSFSSRLLADSCVPTIYKGNNGVGIAFGENARHLPKEAFENGLILDIRAARILMDKGIDVGIEKIGDNLVNNDLYFPKEDNYVVSYYDKNSAYEIEVKPSAEVVVYTEKNGKRFPDTIQYENKNGQKFLIYAYDAAFTSADRYRNYSTQRQLYDSIEWLLGKKLSAKCYGNPDTYILCKENENGMAVGIWNLFADEILHPVIELDRPFKTAEFVNCKGELKGDRIELSEIPPFSFAIINLK